MLPVESDPAPPLESALAAESSCSSETAAIWVCSDPPPRILEPNPDDSDGMLQPARPTAANAAIPQTATDRNLHGTRTVRRRVTSSPVHCMMPCEPPYFDCRERSRLFIPRHAISRRVVFTRLRVYHPHMLPEKCSSGRSRSQFRKTETHRQ